MELPQASCVARAEALARLRVLVVDDNPVNRDVAAAWLNEWGVETVLATDGTEAVHQVVVQGNQFDLVLMDLRMPLMDGFTATARIRQSERERTQFASGRQPIVAYSTDVQGDETHLVQMGFDGVLAKPFTASSLISCLERWCSKKFGHPEDPIRDLP